MTATDDRIAELEAAPDAPEALRVRVARAMYERPIDDRLRASWDEASKGIRGSFLEDADAAIRVITTRVEGAPADVADPAAAVARVEALAERFEKQANGWRAIGDRNPWPSAMARHIRAALAGES